MGYVFSHVAYEAALWDVEKLPDCLQGDDVSVRAVVIAHNRACGDLLATLEKDLRLATNCQDGLTREVQERRKAIELLTAKVRRMSETIRQQGERIKSLEAVKSCKCGGKQ